MGGRHSLQVSVLISVYTILRAAHELKKMTSHQDPNKKLNNPPYVTTAPYQQEIMPGKPSELIVRVILFILTFFFTRTCRFVEEKPPCETGHVITVLLW